MSVAGSLTFVTGGARSGKSAYAVELAVRQAAPTLYVATAEARDAEMRARIQRHRSERPRAWRTLEEPLEISRGLASQAEPGSVAIVDCLTLWVSNLLERRLSDASEPRVDEVEEARRHLLTELERLCALRQERQLRLIVISNEVGSGLVPPSSLGRCYRDLLGEANQAVARHADRVVLLVAGIPVDVKSPAPAA